MADDQTPSSPPGNPFEMPPENGNGTTIEQNGDGLQQNAPGVAAKAGKTYLVLGIVVVVVAFLVYSIFSGEEKAPEVEAPRKEEVAPKPPEPPPLPQPDPVPEIVTPPIEVPPLPEPVKPPVLTPGSANPLLTPEQESAAQAQRAAKLRSGIMVRDGGSGAFGGVPPATSSAPAPSNDPNSQFANSVANTKAERVNATRIGDLRRTIAQGRIIQASLESAINTDLPAPIRAIVSLDVYGEAGTVPLIPKGSRLIGQYNSTLTSGQTRVFVVWTRIIRPDGVDIQLGSPSSPLVDQIGQAGVAGQLDTKFQEIFARALVSSAMNIAMAIGSEKINSGTTTTTSTTTGTQTSGDAATTATTNALNRLGSTTDGFLQRFLSVPPTILVDQGTKVNVFVNKDLFFPNDMSGTVILQ